MRVPHISVRERPPGDPRVFTSLAGLFFIAAFLLAGLAWAARMPAAADLQQFTLDVDDVGEVIWSRKGGDTGQHMGYSLFLGQDKPLALHKYPLVGVKKDWLPLHRDLHIAPETIELWSAQTPATLQVTTYEGMVVALQYEGDTWLGLDEWAHALAIKRANLVGAAGAALALAAGFFGWARRQRAKQVTSTAVVR